jgi:hypothetical protein
MTTQEEESMTTDVSASRNGDKVIIKMKGGIVVTQMTAEEAMKLAQDLMGQADKVLAATAK